MDSIAIGLCLVLLTLPPPYTTGYTTTSDGAFTPMNYMCGGLLEQNSGIISSPFYPNNYPPKSRCTWEIRASPNISVELYFKTVSLESHPSCRYDSVTIYDGPPGSSVLGKICQPGNHTYRSSSNVMNIEFRSDGTNQNIGFEAQYIALVTSYNGPEKSGGILTDLEGEIYASSDDAPDNDRVWYISVKNNYQINLNFTNFWRKTALSCHSFSLSVYDGTPHGSPLLGQLCDKTARDFTSSSNTMSIVYSRLNNDTDSGLEFSALYYSVTNKNPNVTLSCNPYYMEARISPWYLEALGYSHSDIFMNDKQCRPRIVSGWLEFQIPYQRCLTVKKVENDVISYTNTLFTRSTGSGVIPRKQLRLTLKCQMYKYTMVKSNYNTDDIIESTLTQYGLYSANLTIFQSPSFTYAVNEYPYSVNINQNLFLQITLDTSDQELLLFVDTCVASPDPSDFTRNVNYIIRNGCRAIPDYKTYNSNSLRIARFSFSASSFLRQHPKLYIQCKLVVCKQNDYQSRCSRGCVQRHKRSLEPLHEQVHVVAGPVQFLKHE